MNTVKRPTVLAAAMPLMAATTVDSSLCKGPRSHQSYGKNRIFGPKTEILGPKKRSHFLGLTMFWPRPEKVVQRKKVPLPK